MLCKKLGLKIPHRKLRKISAQYICRAGSNLRGCMSKPKSTPRVDAYRERQEALGRKRRPEMYLTDDEHEYLKQQLDAYRSNDEYKRDLIVGLNAIKKFIEHMQECGFIGPPAMVFADQYINDIQNKIHIDE